MIKNCNNISQYYNFYCILFTLKNLTDLKLFEKYMYKKLCVAMK